MSSGAIAAGMQRLGWKKRPHALHELQAAAAIGQMGLIQVYESCFREHELMTSQILLTHEDLADRKRYLNARSTLRTLLGLGVIPIINENDTVAIDEIRFGDNDTLAALVTNLIEADVLIILTDQAGLYRPGSAQATRRAELVAEAAADDPALEAMAGGVGNPYARGGMLTKVLAARRAARSGAHTVIASGHGRSACSRGSRAASRSARGSSPSARRSPRASNGSPTTCRCAAARCSTPAPSRRSRCKARACCRSACTRRGANSSAAKS